MDDAQRLADFARMGADWLWETDAEDRFSYFSVPVTRTGIQLEVRIGHRRRDRASREADGGKYIDEIEAAIERREPFRDFLYSGGVGPKAPYWCLLSGEPRYDSDGTFLGYRGVGRDVTEQVETQRKLERQSQALDAILNATPDGIQVIDSNRATLAVNERVFEIMGLPNRKDQLDPESTLQSLIDLAKRGEYGPGDPETLARQRANATVAQMAEHRSINYERQLTTGRWIESRLRALDDGAFLMLLRDITDAKEHAANLERNSALLSTIISNIDGAISVFDKDMCLIAWNDRLAELIGIAPEIIKHGISLRDVLISQAKAGEFGPCDPETEADLRLRTFIGDQQVITVTERQRPNGRIVERRRSLVPGGGAVTIYIDVTERRQAERQLQELNATLEERIDERTKALGEAESFQRSLITNLPGMVYRYTHDDDAWTLGFVSAGSYELVGVSPEDFVSGKKVFLDLIHPEDQGRVWRDWRAGAATGRPFELEYRVNHADGSVRWLLDRVQGRGDESGKITRIEGVIIDLTARKTMERELERARGHLTDALASFDQNLIIYDADDKLVLSTRHIYEPFIAADDYFKPGRTFEEIFRYAVEHGAIPMPPGADKEKFISDRVAMHKLATGQITVRNLPDGRVLHMTERRSVSGGIVALARDVTEQVKIEQKLREAQRMEAIGQLTGGLAHDLNNYLAVIMANLDMLSECEHSDPQATKLIDGALSGAQRGADLTRSLLAFSRRQPLAPKVLDVGDRVRKVTELLKRTIGEKILLHVHIAPSLWPVKIDGAQLDSAIVNLANNARDAMPDGGELSISVKNVRSDGADGKIGDHVLIDVVDQGVGMSAETLAQAFDPFFSTKGPGHGTGLGLSMVHGFVHQSGGEVRLESAVGKGTTVHILLPRAVEEVEQSSAARSVPSVPRGTESILIVEDNGDVREAVIDQLKSLGYHVADVGNGDEAAALLETRADEFDLVISDMIMPGKIDGLALAKIAVKRWPQLRLLLTSGYSGEYGDEAKDEAFDILRKPYRKAELARAVRTALDK